MISPIKYIVTCAICTVYLISPCTSDYLGDYPPTLAVFSPGEPEYMEVVIRQVGDNLTLVCELRGDSLTRTYVWNYMPDNGTVDLRPLPVEPLSPTTSSRLTKYDLQESDSGQYMCSAPPFSSTKYLLVQPRRPPLCARGAFWCGARCVLGAYVCDGFADCARAEDEAPALCPPHACARNDRLNCSSGRCIAAAACCRAGDALCRQPDCCGEYVRHSRPIGGEEAPPLWEDRRAPAEYGLIQSTIYTVTACALIFMIALVLLVSAVCKMHMKRAALRHYARDDNYALQLQPAAPPRYSAAPSPAHSAGSLTRLTHMFSQRYAQVPTSSELELSVVSRGPDCALSLDVDAPPDSQLDRQRLTLQLGRFQLRLPRARPRPPTPDVPAPAPVAGAGGAAPAPTYTRNGRTIRLLGAALCPAPPPYAEAVRKPPPPPYEPPAPAPAPAPHPLSLDNLPHIDADLNANTDLDEATGPPAETCNVTDSVTGVEGTGARARVPSIRVTDNDHIDVMDNRVPVIRIIGTQITDNILVTDNGNSEISEIS